MRQEVFTVSPLCGAPTSSGRPKCLSWRVTGSLSKLWALRSLARCRQETRPMIHEDAEPRPYPSSGFYSSKAASASSKSDFAHATSTSDQAATAFPSLRCQSCSGTTEEHDLDDHRKGQNHDPHQRTQLRTPGSTQPIRTPRHPRRQSSPSRRSPPAIRSCRSCPLTTPGLDPGAISATSKDAKPDAPQAAGPGVHGGVVDAFLPDLRAHPRHRKAALRRINPHVSESQSTVLADPDSGPVCRHPVYSASMDTSPIFAITQPALYEKSAYAPPRFASKISTLLQQLREDGKLLNVNGQPLAAKADLTRRVRLAYRQVRVFAMNIGGRATQLGLALKALAPARLTMSGRTLSGKSDPEREQEFRPAMLNAWSCCSWSAALGPEARRLWSCRVQCRITRPGGPGRQKTLRGCALLRGKPLRNSAPISSFSCARISAKMTVLRSPPHRLSGSISINPLMESHSKAFCFGERKMMTRRYNLYGLNWVSKMLVASVCVLMGSSIGLSCSPNSNLTIRGYVCTRDELAQSTIRHGIHDDDERYKPLAGVRITLSRSADSTDAIPGFSSISDQKGYYSIDELSRSKFPSVFIIAEKAGYERFAYEIDMGVTRQALRRPFPI
jgi:hypothetical protein